MIPFAAWRQGRRECGIGCADGRTVQLRRHRGPDPGEAPAARDPGDRERGAPLARWRVRPALRADRARVDRARAAAQGLAAAGVLLGPLRAAVDGADRL